MDNVVAVFKCDNANPAGWDGCKMLTTERTRSQLRVLVAEDNPVNQLFAARLIEKQGHIAHVVANGQLAMDAMLNEHFDVVLMDISMPVKDGFEAVQQLREWEEVVGCHIPVIAVTANTSAVDREQCRAKGMDDFVAKPVKASELAAALDRVFRESVCEFPVVESSDNCETHSRTDASCDFPAALRRLNGDENFLTQLAQLFLNTVPGQLQLLKIAATECNGQLTADLAHSIKGSVRHFFAGSAYDAAQRLEFVAHAENSLAMQKTFEELEVEIQRLRSELLNRFPALH